MLQRLIEVGRQRFSFIDFLGGAQQLFERSDLSGAQHVLGRGAREVQGTDSIGAGLEQIGQLVERCGVDILALAPEGPVQDDATAPRIRRGVAQSSGHAQPDIGRNRSVAQRQFRLVDRNAVVPVQIALTVVEDQPLAVTRDLTGNDRCRRAGQSYPHIGFLRRFRGGAIRSHLSPSSFPCVRTAAAG